MQARKPSEEEEVTARREEKQAKFFLFGGEIMAVRRARAINDSLFVFGQTPSRCGHSQLSSVDTAQKDRPRTCIKRLSVEHNVVRIK